MGRFDVTEVNAAVERLIETTENPRHLYLLHAYNRHRYLEIAGRYKEIFEPDDGRAPRLPFQRLRDERTLDGREEVESVYASGPGPASASSTAAVTSGSRLATT